MTERELLIPSLRTRAISRAETLEPSDDSQLLRDLVAEIDRQEETLREIASYADNPGRPVLALIAKEALRRG